MRTFAEQYGNTNSAISTKVSIFRVKKINIPILSGDKTRGSCFRRNDG